MLAGIRGFYPSDRARYGIKESAHCLLVFRRRLFIKKVKHLLHRG